MSDPNDPELRRLRGLVVEAIRQTPAYEIGDPSAIAALDDPTADPSFDALGIDSLGRMEFCIVLSERHGLELAADDLVTHPTVEALVRHLATLQPDGDRDGARPEDGGADTVADVIATIRTAQTAGTLYRTLRDIETRLLPEEAFAILRAVDGAAGLNRSVDAWVARLHGRLFRERSDPRRFTRTTFTEDAILYRPSEGGEADRGLAVLLGGRSQRFFLPMPVILQHFPAGYDVLFLADRRTDQYGAGIEGIADDLDGLCRWIREEAAVGRSDVVVLGSSMGGGPALEVGGRVGARRAVSLGGGTSILEGPDGPRGRRSSGTDGVGAVADCERWCVYNVEYERDRRSGLVLRDAYPGARALALTGAAAHNVLKPVAEAGGLTELLELLVRGHPDGPLDADGAVVRERPQVLESSVGSPRWVRRSTPAIVRRGRRAIGSILRRAGLR